MAAIASGDTEQVNKVIAGVEAAGLQYAQALLHRLQLPEADDMGKVQQMLSQLCKLHKGNVFSACYMCMMNANIMSMGG